MLLISDLEFRRIQPEIQARQTPLRNASEKAAHTPF